jgi:16S rRNA (cytosine1402-N4)-methyltransferase
MQSKEIENLHVPVLLGETLGQLAPKADEIFVDATLGLGGHTEAILESCATVRVIGIDQDAAAVDAASARLSRFGERVRTVHANFSAIKRVVGQPVDGILADLGVSSLQFDSPDRGFSFRFDAPLDMRMDPGSGDETAAELLARLSETEIADLIYRLGEERHSRRIARRIVWKREIGEAVTTTRELAETVEKAIGARSRDKIHPATRTFQALRIAVNGEIEILDGFIADAIGLLKTGGRLAVITFHSLEDRVVKQAFLRFSGRCSCPPRLPECACGATKAVELLTRKPIVPGHAEIARNPRARSAKLRVCKKL